MPGRKGFPASTAHVHRMAPFLAVDLGASSGRMLLGDFTGTRIDVREIHRFPNDVISHEGSLHWDVRRLWDEVERGLASCDAPLEGIGVATWGLDFGLLDRDGQLIGNPFAYRDARTEGVPERVFERIPAAEIFAITGIECMRVNSLYQLASMQNLETTETLLMIPDLFRFWLSGERATEYTIATTTQMVDCRTKSWATEMLRTLDLPTRILAPIIPPGTVVGPRSQGRHQGVPVIAVPGHDTASAVVAIPGLDPHSAYLSSGTWSLMGVEISEPVLSSDALRLGFTNEGGAAGTVRLQKNICGLWLLQESRRQWEREGQHFSWDDLLALAAQAPAFHCVIDPDANEFVSPGDLPGAIREFCSKTGQPQPASVGAVVRCCLEGLALRYRWVLEALERLTGQKITTLRIVGGGSQNPLLCQHTADACGRTVVAGPVEATALGNLAMQAIATGRLADVPAARAVIAASVDLRTFEPTDSHVWDDAFTRFEKLLRRAV